MDPLIIEAAINEQSSKDDNPNVPYSPEECAEDALRCAEAGAAIVHFHARDPRTGALESPGTETYATAIRLIRAERADLLVYPTYTWADTPEQRFVHIKALAEDPTVRLRSATIDPGAVIFGRFDEAGATIEGGPAFVVLHDEVQYFLSLCDRYAIQYSVVVREPGHVRMAVAYHRAGWMRGTICFKLNLADDMLWGLPPSKAAVDTYMGLVPPDIPFTWIAYTYGPSCWEMTSLAITTGAHVRVGLGDNPVEADGSRPDNAELVRRVVAMAGEHGRAVASPDEAHAILTG